MSRLRRASFFLCALLPAIAHAGLQATPANVPADAAAPSVAGELLGIVVPLGLIIAALFAVLYIARRRFGLTGQDAPLSIVQILPVGPRERVVLVKARSGRVFVVGVGGQKVNFITDLDPADVEAVVSAPETGAKASLARRFLAR